MYNIFLSLTGGPWRRFLEEERYLHVQVGAHLPSNGYQRFLHVQVGAHLPSNSYQRFLHVQVGAHLPSNCYQWFLSPGKKLQWLKAGRFSPFNSRLRMYGAVPPLFLIS